MALNIFAYVLRTFYFTYNHGLNSDFSYIMLQEMYGKETASAMLVNHQNRENPEELREFGSRSSSDSATKTVAEQMFTGHRRTPSDHTLMDSPHNPYVGTTLSADAFFEASHWDRTESGRWSSAVEISSTGSHEKCSSLCSQNTVPASPTCTSTSSRSETYDDSSEKHFRQNSTTSPSSPSPTFRGPLKSRLLQRAGVLADGLSAQSHPDLWQSPNSGKPPGLVYAEDPPLNSQVLREPRTTSSSVHVNRSPQNSEDLTESHVASAQRVPGIYAEKSSPPQSSQYLADSRTTQAVPSRFTYLPPPAASQAVYPTLYRPGLAYHEAAATAALFYNQLAAVHQLQQQQQRLFLGAQNQLTMPAEGHAHTSLHAQNEAVGLLRIQQADKVTSLMNTTTTTTAHNLTDDHCDSNDNAHGQSLHRRPLR